MFNDPSPRKIAFKTQIQTHINLLSQLNDSVKNKLKEITADTKKYEFRSKRGLINGIGSIFKSITGNLDSSDGEHYNECIDKINRDEREIESLLKNQISVTTSVIKNFNSTIQNLQIDEETFNKNIDEIQNSLINISDDLAFYEAQINTLDLCQSLMESFVFLEESLDDILNAITFARLKILHSSIITPTDLIYSLQDISKSLSKTNLPLPTYTSNVAQYLEIIELEAYQSDNKIVFILKIPLIEPETFTLYRIFPIPILDNRTGIYHILPSNLKYIARDDDSLSYVLPQDINKCKPLKPYVKICSNLLQYPIDSDAICEAQLLRQSDKLPKTCETSILLASGYNIQEVEMNYWLISISDPLPVTIRCNNKELVTEMIRRNSLLKLQPFCNGFIGTTRIQSKPFVEKYKNVTYKNHQIKIPYECCKHLPEKIHVPELKPLKLNKIDVEDLNAVHNRLSQYSEELDRLVQQPFVTKHIHWFTIVTISFIIFLIILYICCKCRRKKPNRLSLTDGSNPPSPPRDSPRESLQQKFRQFIPRRRASVHPEEAIEEEAFELRSNPTCY